MHQLHSSDYPKLEPYFAQTPANVPMLRAFFEGRVPGHAFVDSLPTPAAAVVTVNYRFVFFGGTPSPAFQQTAIRQLRYQQAIDVVWPAASGKLPQAIVPDERVARIEYRRRRSTSVDHLDKLAAGAPQAEVRRIDSRNIADCLWREDVQRATGSTSEFLGHGLGFCLVVDEAIVAEAYAVIWSSDSAEIATVTHPKHRGRGYATVLCASLIKACEAVELQTYWNTDTENHASMRLAARLGYQDPHDYQLLRFSHQAPVSKFVPKKKRPRTLRSFAKQLFGRSKPTK
jgi:RimJ/RimL family protein N-acetyltransferase